MRGADVTLPTGSVTPDFEHNEVMEVCRAVNSRPAKYGLWVEGRGWRDGVVYDSIAEASREMFGAVVAGYFIGKTVEVRRR